METGERMANLIPLLDSYRTKMFLEKLKIIVESYKDIDPDDLTTNQNDIIVGFDELSKATKEEDWGHASVLIEIIEDRLKIEDDLKPKLEVFAELDKIEKSEEYKQKVLSRETEERLEKNRKKKLKTEEKSQRSLADAERQYSGIQAMFEDISTRLKSAQDKLLLLAKKGEGIREKSKGVFGFFRKLSGSIREEEKSNKLEMEEAEKLSEKLKLQLAEANKELDSAHIAFLTASAKAREYEVEEDNGGLEEEKKGLEVLSPGKRVQSFSFREPPGFGIDPSSVETDGAHKTTLDLGGVAIFSSRTDTGGLRSKYKENEDVHLAGVNPEDPSLGDAAGAANILTFDGAGGSKDGKLAAVISADFVLKSLENGMPIDEALRQANAEMYEKHRGSYCCGTVIQIYRNGNINIGHVGDTKVTTIRNGQTLREGTTRLQNNATYLVDTGEIQPNQYYTHTVEYMGQQRLAHSMVYNSIGHPQSAFESLADPSLKFQGKDGDLLISASDGLSDVMSEYEVEMITAEVQSENPDGIIDPEVLRDRLYALAFERNNATTPFDIALGPEDGNSVTIPKHSKSGGDNITISVTKIDLRAPELPAVVEQRAKKDKVVRGWFRKNVVDNKAVREVLIAGGVFGAAMGLAIFGPDTDESDYAPEQPSISKQSPDLEKFPDQDAEMTFDIDEVPAVDANNIEDDPTEKETKTNGDDKKETPKAEKSNIDLSDEIATPGTNPIRMLDSIIERPGMREAIINSERKIHREYDDKDDDWVVKKWRTKQWWSSFKPTVDKEKNTVHYKATVRADKQKTTVAFIETSDDTKEITVFWKDLGGQVTKPLPATFESETLPLPNLFRPAEPLYSTGEIARMGKPLDTAKLVKLQFADGDESDAGESVEVEKDSSTILAGEIPDRGEIVSIPPEFFDTEKLEQLIRDSVDLGTEEESETTTVDADDNNPAIKTLGKKIKELIALKKQKNEEVKNKKIAKLKEFKKKLEDKT